MSSRFHCMLTKKSRKAVISSGTLSPCCYHMFKILRLQKGLAMLLRFAEEKPEWKWSDSKQCTYGCIVYKFVEPNGNFQSFLLFVFIFSEFFVSLWIHLLLSYIFYSAVTWSQLSGGVCFFCVISFWLQTASFWFCWWCIFAETVMSIELELALLL